MIRYIMNPPVHERLLTGRWLVTAHLDEGDNPVVATLRIVSVEQLNPEALRLSGQQGQDIGSCQLIAARSEAAPLACDMVGLKNFGDVHFTSIGYDRMSGEDQNGRRILAIRISQ